MAKPVIKKQSLLTRGRIAKQLKINAETLRYYEIRGLIKSPSRLANNYRVYKNTDVEKLKFILMAKNLSFSLNEIQQLLPLSYETKN